MAIRCKPVELVAKHAMYAKERSLALPAGPSLKLPFERADRGNPCT